MDGLIQMHDEYLHKVISIAMLDSKGKILQKEIHTVLGYVLEFRSICKKYLPRRESSAAENDEYDDEQDHKVNTR